ncbi:MAG: hypothetical protein HYU69_03020 [Bacteroidetes bacterium]|nr:hypothetical protein [Bacteroidota bacterium]
MKTSAKKLVSAFILMTLSAAIGFAGNSGTDTSKMVVMRNVKCLDVIVKASEKTHSLSDITLKVYLGNEVVFEINNISRKKISLNVNEHYTIEVSKEGYFSKLVSVSTFMPSDADLDDGYVYEYDLDFDLVKQKKGIDTYYMDFPIALISYNGIKDKFDYSRKYTKHIVKEIRKNTGNTFAKTYTRE